jgi:PIN domain nuclease of toxin-antitoxin system
MAGGLNWVHSDPFDRMLVAQAMRLNGALVTADKAIAGYKEIVQLWAG